VNNILCLNKYDANKFQYLILILEEEEISKRVSINIYRKKLFMAIMEVPKKIEAFQYFLYQYKNRKGLELVTVNNEVISGGIL